MAIEFATDEWIKALEAKLNSSDKYKQAAAKWEGDFYFVVEPDEGGDSTYLYLNLYHGDASEGQLMADPSSKKAAFELSAPLSVWKGVLDHKIDPIRGIMTRQLKLKGNMMKVMKAPKAATELVECATQIDTVWPE